MPVPEQTAEGDLSRARDVLYISAHYSRKDRFWAALFDRLGPFSDDLAIAVL